MRKTNILWVTRGTAKPDLCFQLMGRWCPGSRGILWSLEGLLGIRRRARAESCSGGENSKWKPERKREPAGVRSGTWALRGGRGEGGRWRPKWTGRRVCLKGGGVGGPWSIRHIALAMCPRGQALVSSGLRTWGPASRRPGLRPLLRASSAHSCPTVSSTRAGKLASSPQTPLPCIAVCERAW